MLYLPFDNIDLIDEINGEFNRIGNSNNLTNDYGWLSPLDFGKSSVLEYDYYYDAWEPSDVNRAQHAVQEAAGMIERFRKADSRIKSVLDLFNQGFSRMESLLYL